MTAHKLITVESADLLGTALVWAVATALQYDIIQIHDKAGGMHVRANGALIYWGSSLDWSQVGPLMEDCGLSVVKTNDGWFACKVDDQHWIDTTRFDEPWQGCTASMAVCRAIVATKLGQTVEVPAELVESPHAQ